MQTAAAIALLAMFSTPEHPISAQQASVRFQLAQATPPSDSAHTLFQPNAPDPGRIGQTQQLSTGGIGVTTGGTPNYQTLGTPGGSGVVVPNGSNTATVISPGGRTGTATQKR